MTSRVTTNPSEIRDWAESWGGRPASVRHTGRRGDPGVIRIMFPDSPWSEHEELMPISWDEFFDKFEDRDLALIYEDDSRFNKLVGRETVERRAYGDRSHRGRHDEDRDHRRGRYGRGYP